MAGALAAVWWFCWAWAHYGGPRLRRGDQHFAGRHFRLSQVVPVVFSVDAPSSASAGAAGADGKRVKAGAAVASASPLSDLTALVGQGSVDDSDGRLGGASAASMTGMARRPAADNPAADAAVSVGVVLVADKS